MEIEEDSSKNQLKKMRFFPADARYPEFYI